MERIRSTKLFSNLNTIVRFKKDDEEEGEGEGKRKEKDEVKM